MKNYCQIINETTEKILNNFRSKEEIVYTMIYELDNQVQYFRDVYVMRSKYGLVATPKDPVILPPRHVMFIGYNLNVIMIYDELFKPEYKIPFEFCFFHENQKRKEFKMLKFPQIFDNYRESNSRFMYKVKEFNERRLDRHAFEHIICNKDLESHKIKYQQLKDFLSVREYDLNEKWRLEKEFLYKYSFSSVAPERKDELREFLEQLTKKWIKKETPKQLSSVESRLLNLETMFNDII